MKKLICLLLILSTLFLCTGCVSKNSYNSLKSDLDVANVELDKTKKELQRLTSDYSELESQKNDLEKKLDYHTYKSGTPTEIGHDNFQNTELIASMEEELINTNLRITGKVTNPICYFDEDTGELDSISYTIETEKGGHYEAFNTYDEKGLFMSTIYINSELCCFWTRDYMVFMPEPKVWHIDRLDNN